MGDIHPPPESPPSPPAPTSDHNGESPTSPFPVPWTSETTGSSPGFSKAGSSPFPAPWTSETTVPGIVPGFSKAGSSRFSLASATPHFIGGKEVPHSGMHHSSPFHKLGLRFDVMHTGGGLIPSISRGVDEHYECATELRFGTVSHAGHQDAATTSDLQSFLVHTRADQSALDVVSSLETRGADHGPSYSAPPYMFEPPTNPTLPPLSRFVHPNSLELAPTNSPYRITPLIDPSNAALGGIPLGSKALHHLTPPPEVAALLTTQSSGDVVTAVFARNSPLVPWELPSEIEYFWSGLFKISEVKVTHACHFQITGLILLWV
jgi:hypothetical protein